MFAKTFDVASAIPGDGLQFLGEVAISSDTEVMARSRFRVWRGASRRTRQGKG